MEGDKEERKEEREGCVMIERDRDGGGDGVG